MKTKHKVTLYTIFLIAVMGVVLVSVGYYEVSHSFYGAILKEQEIRMRVAWRLLEQQGTPFQIKNGKLLAGQAVLNGDSALVDQIANLVGGTASIFQDDVRIATNVRLPDGSRAIGTRLASEPARDALFKQRQNYRGEALILGEPYVTAYDLIRGPDGNVIGLLQVGTKKSAYSDSLASILRRSLLVTLLSMIVIGFVVYADLNALTHKLQRTEHFWRLILESTGEGIYDVDLEGRCTFINHTGAEMLGFSPAELIGKEIHSTIHHRHPGGAPYPIAECRLCKLLSKEQVRRSDEVFWKKNGEAIPVRYLSSPIVDRGTVRGAVVAFNEIAARKQVEAKLEGKIRELEAALAAAVKAAGR